MKSLKQLAKRLFQYEARLVLKKYKPKIIAITGSVGKTMTKDVMYQIISKKFFVRKSEKSFTTELGIPLTIIGCPYSVHSIIGLIRNVLFGWKLLLWKNRYPEWLIIEVDADKPGDLSRLSSWFMPDILVITAIGDVPTHIEYFDNDVEKFLGEKRELLDAVSRNGVIIYNADDNNVGSLVALQPIRMVSCGLLSDCTVSASEYDIQYAGTKTTTVPTGMSFTISRMGESYPITLFSTLGTPMQYACLLAVATACELGMTLADSVPIVARIGAFAGRMRILNGIKDSIIIDDSYNSSPIAMWQAIDALAGITSDTRKIVVVGDMLELGKYSTEEHKRLAQKIKDEAQYVMCVGIRTRRIADELLSNGFPEDGIMMFDTSREAGTFLQNIIQTGDVVLIKGSQTMRMERVVEEVMRHPEDKAKLLCRQEPEWLERD